MDIFDDGTVDWTDPVPGDPQNLAAPADGNAAEPYGTDRVTEPGAGRPPTFAGTSEVDTDNGWNVGINEDTGNTVSQWPGGRYFDNGTDDEVEPI